MKKYYSNSHVNLISSMLERVSDAVVAFDKDWNYVYVNQKAVQMLNRQTPDELIGKHVWTEFPESVNLPIYQIYHRALETQEATYLEEYHPLWGRWYENRIYPSPDGITSYFTDITERKRNEIEIRRKNEQLQLALKAASVGLWDWDIKANTVRFSSEWKSQIGYEDDEITNDFKEWESRVHPDDLEKALKTVQDFLAVPYPDYHNEFRFRHKDGTYRWILAQADLLYDEAGEPVRMLGSHIDITDHKRSEMMLRKQQEQLALIYDTVTNVIFYLTVEDGNKFRFASVNQAFLNITGLKSEDVAGKLVEQVIPEPSLTFALEKYESAIRTKMIIRWEETTTYPAGTVTGEVNIAPILDNEGHCTHLVGSVHDITTRKHAEDAIRDNEERLRLSTELANVAVWEYDLIKNEMKRSHNHDALYGLEPQPKWQIETFLNSTHPDDREMSNQIVQGAIVAGGYDKYRFDFRVVWADESIHWLSVTGEVVRRDANHVAQLVRGATIDITERKHAEEVLKASEQLFSNAFHVGPAGMTITRVSDGKFIDANESFCQMFEYHRDEVVGLTSTDLKMWTPEERQKLIRQQIETGGLDNFELVALARSGRPIHILFSSKEMLIDGERCHLTTMIDISDRKQIESALKLSEENFRSVYEQSPLAIQIYNQEGKLIDVNQQTLEMYGVDDKKYLLGYNIWSSPNLTEEKREALNNGQAVFVSANLDFELVKQNNLFPTNKSGIIHLEMYAVPFMREKERAGYLVHIIDVTGRYLAEQELEASEKRFRALIEKSSDAIVLSDIQGNILYHSPSVVMLSGYTEEEYRQMPVTDRIHPDDMGKLAENFKWLLEHPGETLEFESRSRHKDGTWHTMYNKARNLLDDPAVEGIITNFSDITDRKKAEEALEISERRFRTLIEKSSDILLLIDEERKITYASPAIESILGYTPEEFAQLNRFDLVHPDDIDGLMSQAKWSMAHPGEAIEGEHRVRHKDGTWRVFRRIIRNLLHDASIKALVSNLADITDRKRAEKMLEVSERHFRTLIEKSQDFIILFDAEIKPTYVSPSTVTVLGYSPEEFMERGRQGLVHPEDIKRLGDLYAETLKHPNNALESEIRARHKDGSWRTLRWMARNLLHDPDINAIVANLSDITERKQAENELRISERLFYNTFHVGPAGMTITRIADGKFIDVNDFFCQMFEFKRDEVIGHTSIELNMWQPEERKKVIKKQLEVGGLQNFELILQSKSGKNINILFSSRELLIGDEVCHLTTLIDISERKRVEEALRKSEEKFAHIFELSPIAATLAYFTDNQFVIVDVNEAMEVLTGYSRNEMLNQGTSALNLHANPQMRSNLGRMFNEEGSYKNIEMQLRRKSGELRNLLLSSGRIELAGEVYAIMTAHDITERKLAEQALHESEKLFSDIFHMSPIGMVITHGTDYKIIDINESWAKMLEFNRDEVIGKTSARLNLLATEERKRAMQQLIESDELFNFEMEVQSKSGKVLNVLISSKKLKIKGETCYLTTLIDISERKQAEKALFESEEKYRTLIENASDGIFVSDAQGYYTEVNTRGCSMLGYTGEELIGMHLSKLVASDNLQTQPLRLDELRSGKSLVVERLLNRKDGSHLPVEISAKMLPNGNLLGIVRDISERKQAEATLRAREERFRLAMENIPDVVVIYDTDLRIQFINNATRALTGRSTSDYIGYRDDEIWPPEVYESYLPALEEALKDKTTISLETDLRVADDVQLNLLITCVPILDDENNVREVIGITHNMTEHKEAERALQHYNDRLKLLRQIDIDIIAARSSKDIADVVLNHMQKLLSSENAILSIFDEDIREITIFSTSNENDTVFQSDRRFSVQNHPHQILLGSGKTIVVPDLLEVDSVSDLGKQYLDAGIRSILIEPLQIQKQAIGNITLTSKLPNYFTPEYQEIIKEVANQLAIALNQSRLYEQIEQANADLEQRVIERTKQLEAKNQELETFTYTVSHDLKAPLRGIDGYSRLLLDDFSDVLNEDGQSFLENINIATNQMNQLIDDLLTYSRLERRTLQENQVNIGNLLQSIIQDHMTDIKKYDITLNIDLPEILISADTNGISMALRNLIENAIKFRHEDRQAMIEINGSETETACTIWVKDNGIGFDMQYHDRILQIFQRLHRAEDYQGTGIGLAIVHKALTRMGGRVWAESELGVGSTFFLEIPK